MACWLISLALLTCWSAFDHKKHQTFKKNALSVPLTSLANKIMGVFVHSLIRALLLRCCDCVNICVLQCSFF